MSHLTFTLLCYLAAALWLAVMVWPLRKNRSPRLLRKQLAALVLVCALWPMFMLIATMMAVFREGWRQ